jgi:hypothetical protein
VKRVYLDLRYPIGLLLVTFGSILILQGALVGTPVLGVNVDLYWGVFMLVCGIAALTLARRSSG